MWHEGYIRRVVKLIILNFRAYDLVVPPYSHGFIQVMMPAHDTPGVGVDGRDGRVDTHYTVLIPAGTTHMFETTGASHFIVFDIPDQTMDAPDLGGLAGYVSFLLTPSLRALMTRP